MDGHCYVTGVCQPENHVKDVFAFVFLFFIFPFIKQKRRGAASTLNQTAIRGF
jgi:hypothetical protein